MINSSGEFNAVLKTYFYHSERKLSVLHCLGASYSSCYTLRCYRHYILLHVRHGLRIYLPTI